MSKFFLGFKKKIIHLLQMLVNCCVWDAAVNCYGEYATMHIIL